MVQRTRGASGVIDREAPHPGAGPAAPGAPDPGAGPAPDGRPGSTRAERRRAREAATRRERRRRAQRRRFWLVVMPLVVLALAATALVGMWLRDDDAASDGAARARTPAPARPASADVLLLVHRGADGRADLVTVLGTEDGNASVLLVPTATQIEVPSLGIQPLSELPSTGDASTVQVAMENLLGVRVADTLVVDDALLESMLAPAQPIGVELTDEVVLGGGLESLRPGSHELSAAAAARALTVPQEGSELDRLVTTQAVLDGWMARLQVPEIARATVAEHPQLQALVDAARANARQATTLPVDPVGTGGPERFEVRRADLQQTVRGAFRGALLGPGGRRPRVEVLNGTGAVGVAQATAAAVVPAGGEVTLSGNVPGFGLDQTQVVYYDASRKAAAQRLLDALGCGVLKRSDGGFAVVDVTILVGADCPAFGAPDAAGGAP
jgi:hypothetical protein